MFLMFSQIRDGFSVIFKDFGKIPQDSGWIFTEDRIWILVSQGFTIWDDSESQLDFVFIGFHDPGSHLDLVFIGFHDLE